MKIKSVLRGIHWIITIFIFFYIVTGFGITEYQIVETLTFGVLSKALSLQLHTLLIYPFIALIILHIFITMNRKKIIHFFDTNSHNTKGEASEESSEKIKKILVWLVVLFICTMLILLVIAQPRFYTFVN
jgi:cytochrome b561